MAGAAGEGAGIVRRTVPDVIHSTMGQANPSPLTLRTNYCYQDRPGWPDDPASRDGGEGIEAPKGGAKARKAERERKLAEFTAARTEGLDEAAAGERVGVTRKTAARYEKARLAALPAGGSS